MSLELKLKSQHNRFSIVNCIAGLAADRLEPLVSISLTGLRHSRGFRLSINLHVIRISVYLAFAHTEFCCHDLRFQPSSFHIYERYYLTHLRSQSSQIQCLTKS